MVARVNLAQQLSQFVDLLWSRTGVVWGRSRCGVWLEVWQSEVVFEHVDSFECLGWGPHWGLVVWEIRLNGFWNLFKWLGMLSGHFDELENERSHHSNGALTSVHWLVRISLFELMFLRMELSEKHWVFLGFQNGGEFSASVVLGGSEESDLVHTSHFLEMSSIDTLGVVIVSNWIVENALKVSVRNVQMSKELRFPETLVQFDWVILAVIVEP